MKKNSPPAPNHAVQAQAGRTKQLPAMKESSSQLELFASAMNLFHRRDFHAALDLFTQAAAGSNRDIAHAARQHRSMCEQRVANLKPDLRTAEDHYQYGIGLIAIRKLEAACEALAKAAELDPRAGHIHYALAISVGLSGDLANAARHLATAIQLDPKNRSIARTDPDFLEFGRYSPVRELVFLEKKEPATQLPS